MLNRSLSAPFIRNIITLMKSLRILSMTLFLATCSSLTFAQDSNQPNSNSTFFVRIENLNVDNYPTLYNNLKTDGRFEVGLACVPAQILTIRVLDSSNADMAKNIQDFKTIATEAQLALPVVLTDFDADRFFDACSAARN